MKEIKSLIICLIFISIFIVSCRWEEDDLGYPTKVSFSKEGGSKKIYGDAGLHILTLRDRQGNTTCGRPDSLDENIWVVKSDWLTAKSYPDQGKVEIIATKNVTSKKREIIIEGDRAYTITSIRVIQNP